MSATDFGAASASRRRVFGQHVLDHGVDDAAHRLVDQPRVTDAGIFLGDDPEHVADQRQLHQVGDLEQAGAQAVVDVVVVVGDVVAQGSDLRLRPGMAAELEVMVLAIFDDGGRQLAERAAILQQRPVVLHRALERFPGEVEPVELGIALLELGEDAERLCVVVEAAIGLHRGVQRLLAGMAERRVAEIVGERHRLAEILVEPERAADGAGDLRHFQRVGEPCAVVVALVIDEDLRLVLQPPERRRMDDAVAGRAGTGCGSAPPARGSGGRGSATAGWHRLPAPRVATTARPRSANLLLDAA